MLRRRTPRDLIVLAAFTAVGFAALVTAGPLNPPAGPVTSTYKTLAEVEPRIAINSTNTPGGASGVYRITQPGSYYLTSGFTVPSGRNGIEIASNNVTIDLSGFTITGVPGSLDGIKAADALRFRLTIRNGVITAMGDDGIDVYTPNPATPLQVTVENITAQGCGQYGIVIPDGEIRSCLAQGNGGTGIFFSGYLDSSAEDCVATGNGGDGIRIGRGAVRGCSASSNSSAGIHASYGTVSDSIASANAVGFTGDTMVITSCTALSNTQTGIRVGGNAVVRGNTVSAYTLIAGSIGIQTQNTSGARVEDNNITRQATAINCTTANNFVVGNSMHGCTTAVNAVANNRIGTLVTGTASPAINGNTGGGLGTTDPLANIIY